MDSEKLLRKGWSDTHIHKAQAILHHNEKHDIFFAKFVFWTALLVIIFANVLVSLILIPFLLVFNGLFLYIIIVFLAGTIGFMYNFLVNDAEHLERRHHAIASIIIPIIALVNVLIMVVTSNRYAVQVKAVPHNPILIAVVFAGVFILPYVMDRIRISMNEGRRAVLVR